MKLRPGQSTTVAGYTLTYTGIDPIRNDPNRRGEYAVPQRRRPLEGNASQPGDVTYTGFQETDRDVGDQDGLAARRGSLRDRGLPDRRSNVVFFNILVKPLVNLIWVAGIVFVLGSLIALWPDAREQRRLATRLAPARA